jgi:metacaspase-1
MDKAFLAGINDYISFPDNSLRGCLNDVADLRDILVSHYTFDAGAIRTLCDRDATRQALLDGLAWLLADATAGDVRLFHFSGHGTQVPDVNGDETDGADEVLVPTDHDWNNPLTDDELCSIFSAIPDGVHFCFVADCCHSGTIQRALWDRRVLNRPRYVPPPAALARQIAALAGQVRQRENRYEYAPYGRHVLLAACRDSQSATDAYIGSTYNGAFTWALCSVLRQAGPDLTYAALMSQAAALMSDYGQVPQLECPPALAQHLVFTGLVN